jgi:putative transposase
MVKGYKYRIYPNKRQEQQINQMLGNARFVYNWALDRRIKEYQSEKKNISAFTLMTELTQLKKNPEYNWLKLSVAQSLQQSIVNMDKAFTRFFKQKKGFPKFKSKHKGTDRVGFPQNTKVDFKNNKVSVNKIGWINTKISRTFDGKIKTATIEKTPTGKFFISITVELPDVKVKQKPISKTNAVGIDTGIKTFATLSDGTEIENPKHLKSNIQRLKVLQKRASKKQKGSKNRRKANLQIARLHEKIANQRLDFLHKTTTAITKQYDTVACENLNVSGMLKNHKLAQSIADLGLGRFYTLLQYKMEEQGGNYLEIGRFEPSSKMCRCGIINKSLQLSDREWVCPECGLINQRDVLAANNILKFALNSKNKTTDGMSGIACGDVGISQVDEAGTVYGRSLRS